MFDQQQADYLINLPKKIIFSDQIMDKYPIQQKNPLELRLNLVTPEEEDFNFLLVISQSKKNNIKINLHHQEDESKIGLLRVDYNGTHKNPEVILPQLPDKFKPYAGKWFDYSEHHIHYYIEGYGPLEWAIPLIDDDFKIKSIQENKDMLFAISEFANRINIQTEIQFISEELFL